MKTSPDDSDSAPSRKSADDDQFRAVVKRLLNTPPMHKAAKPSRSAADVRRPSKGRVGKHED